MANAIYPKWKEAIIQATANSSLGGTIKVALVDTGTYTYSSAQSKTLSDVLTQVRIVRSGSNTFDGGRVSVGYR